MLLDHLDVGVWAHRSRRNYPWRSTGRAATIGEQPDTLIGRRFTDLVDPPLSDDGWHLLLSIRSTTTATTGSGSPWRPVTATR